MGKGKGFMVKGKGAEYLQITYQRIWMRQWINRIVESLGEL
jgi:hypothetical protein